MTDLIAVHSGWKRSKSLILRDILGYFHAPKTSKILRCEHCSHSHIFCPALGWFIEVKGVLRTFSSSSSWPVYMSPKRNVGRGAFTTPSYLIYPTSKTLKQGAITFEHVGGCSGIWWDLFSPYWWDELTGVRGKRCRSNRICLLSDFFPSNHKEMVKWYGSSCKTSIKTSFLSNHAQYVGKSSKCLVGSFHHLNLSAKVVYFWHENSNIF